jgi:hypothetical protein
MGAGSQWLRPAVAPAGRRLFMIIQNEGAAPPAPTRYIRTSGASASRISAARSTALPSSAAGSPTAGSKFRS